MKSLGKKVFLNCITKANGGFCAFSEITSPSSLGYKKTSFLLSYTTGMWSLLITFTQWLPFTHSLIYYFPFAWSQPWQASHLTAALKFMVWFALWFLQGQEPTENGWLPVAPDLDQVVGFVSSTQRFKPLSLDQG